MHPFSVGSKSSPGLLKETLAARLREEILSGGLAPGQPVVETQWAPRLKVAQASVREAIHILVSEGFLVKQPGRSARVTKFSAADVADLYEVRAALEGLAARLTAERRAEVSELERAIEQMSAAARRRDVQGVVEQDLRFHLQLCEQSGNRFLVQHAHQVLVPLFAFTLIRAGGKPSATQAWADSVGVHHLLVDAVRSGDPMYAEQTAVHVVRSFSRVARDGWVEDQPGRVAGGETECARLRDTHAGRRRSGNGS